MKRKVMILAMLACLALTGCEESGIEVTPSVETVQMEYSDFNLVTDSKTGIVYIDNKFDYQGGLPAHVYTPYYGKNGRPCKFIDGRVVEIEK